MKTESQIAETSVTSDGNLPVHVTKVDLRYMRHGEQAERVRAAREKGEATHRAHVVAVAKMTITEVRDALHSRRDKNGYLRPDRELFNRLHHLTHAQGRRKANGALSWEEELRALGLKPATVRQWKRRYHWTFDDWLRLAARKESQ